MKIPSYLYHSKIGGIYCIENSVNHKRYIGSSTAIYSRLSKHKSLLKHNKHENIYLQNAVNKYGIENFECYMIELIEDPKLLTNKEQNWIDKLNPEYNLTKKVERNILSKESCKKISDTLLKKYSNDEIKGSIKSILVYDLNGTFIKEYESLKTCSKDLNVSVSSIIRVAKGFYNQANGYQFRYVNSTLPVTSIHPSKYYRRFHKPAPLKQDELLENPTLERQKEGNQQPSLSSNTLEGSTTNSQILPSHVEDSNADTSVLHIDLTNYKLE